MKFGSGQIGYGGSVTKRLRPWLAASVIFLGAAAARAQFPGDVPDTFRLKLGGMYAWFNTEVTFQETVTGEPVGSGISMEDVLGQKPSTAGFAARGDWNFLGRFFLDFGYTGFSRSTTVGILQDVTFGGVTYTSGVSATSSMKSQLPYVDFRYGFIKTEALQLGLSLGAAYPIMQAEVSASAGVVGPGGPIVGETVTRTAKIEVPVPLLGFQFDAKLGDGLSTGVIINGIFAPVHPYTGSVIDAEAHLDWYATRNFGVGAAFDYTRFNLKREQTNSTVQFRYNYYGPRVYAILTF
jgi:hypothetical protein